METVTIPLENIELVKLVNEKREQLMFPFLVTISPDAKTITIIFKFI